MKLLGSNIDTKRGEGYVALMATHPDDMYTLSSLVGVGDVIETMTTRRLPSDPSHDRNPQKKVLKLAIRVEKLTFDLEEGIMHAKGKVCQDNAEGIVMGVYHTFNIPLAHKFVLTRKNWTNMDAKLLNESLKIVPSICFAILYDKECVVSLVSPGNINKIYQAEIKCNNYDHAVSEVVDHKENVAIIIVAGFSTFGETFTKALIKKDHTLGPKISTVKLGSNYKNLPNSKVINRILYDKEYARQFAAVQYVKDIQLVEEFLLDVDAGKPLICVGMNEVKEALDYGAVKTLFITSDMYRPATIEKRDEIEKCLSLVSELHAKICVIPSKLESGEKLQEIGGIAGILQFQYK